MTDQALERSVVVGVIGAGAMGAGIAQVAAQAGHRVLMFDAQPGAVERANRAGRRFAEGARGQGPRCRRSTRPRSRRACVPPRCPSSPSAAS